MRHRAVFELEGVVCEQIAASYGGAGFFATQRAVTIPSGSAARKTVTITC